MSELIGKKQRLKPTKGENDQVVLENRGQIMGSSSQLCLHNCRCPKDRASTLSTSPALVSTSCPQVHIHGSSGYNVKWKLQSLFKNICSLCPSPSIFFLIVLIKRLDVDSLVFRILSLSWGLFLSSLSIKSSQISIDTIQHNQLFNLYTTAHQTDSGVFIFCQIMLEIFCLALILHAIIQGEM